MSRDTNDKPQSTERRMVTAWRTYQVRVELIRDVSPPCGEPITTPEAVYELFREDAARWDRERFFTVLLDQSHRLLGVEEVSVGTVNFTPVHPREVMKAVILGNAPAFIAVHNHLTDQLRPSDSDLAITRRLRQVADLLQVRCLDHVIVGPTGYFSFVDHDLWGALDPSGSNDVSSRSPVELALINRRC